MRSIAIVVEGQTEEQFVSRVLQPFVGHGTVLQPIVGHTKRTARGTHRGGAAWKHYRRQISKLVAEPHWAMVTTMIDFYAYPRDAPGWGDCHGGEAHDRECVTRRERLMSEDICAPRFRPFLMLHEFETLVVAAVAVTPGVVDDPQAAEALSSLVDGFGGEPERINDGPETAPSKRVQDAVRMYSKVQDGVAILEETDFRAVLSLCPHFSSWVADLREA